MALPTNDKDSSDFPTEHALDAEPYESKSQRKRNAHQITLLASELVSMTPKALSSLPLQAPVAEAIKHCAEIRSHGARKRQLHYVSKLLRETSDLEQLQKLINQPDKSTKKVPIPNPHIGLRDKLLLNFADHVDELRSNYPSISVQQVRQLVRKAQSQSKAALDAQAATQTDAREKPGPGKDKSAEDKPADSTELSLEDQPHIALADTQAARSLLQLLSNSA